MIAFEELFPFGDLTRLLQQLQTEEKKLSSGRESFSQKYKETLKEEIALIADLKKQLQGIGTVSLKGDGLAKVGEEVDKVGKKIQGYRDLINTLTSAEAANSASIEKLRGTLAQLKSQYDKLDPTMEGFAATQQELAQKSMYVKQAMDAQLSAIKTATKTVKQVENSYAYLNAETGKLRNQLKNLPDAFNSATGAINKHNSVAVALQAQIQKNDRALKAMDANMGLYQRNVGNYSSAFSGLGSALVQFTGIAGGVDLAVTAITKSFEVMSSFERYRSVIGFASKDTAEFNANLAFLENIANSTGTEIEVLYKKYASFAIAAREANYSQKQTQDIFGSVIRAGGALKMSNEGIELSLKALEQMLSKGKISAEELRQQLGDHLPGAMQLFSKGLGISVEKLGDMMKAGEILSADALPKFAAQLDKTFGAAAQTNVNTISGSFNRLTNELKLMVDAMAQDSGVSSFFSRINNGLADMLRNWKALISEQGFASFMMLIATGQFGQLSVQSNAAGSRASEAAANQRADEAEREGVRSAMSKMTQAQRDLVIASRMAQVQRDEEHSKTSKQAKEKYEDSKRQLRMYQEINAELKKSTPPGAPAKTPKPSGGGASSVKEADTQLEKLLKDLGKIQDILLDDALQDIKRGEAVSLPEETLKKWRELYALLVKVSKATGVDIPSKLREFNERIDPQKVIGGSTPLTPISTVKPLGKQTGIGDMLTGVMSKNNTEEGMSEYINLVKEQGFEGLRLQESFSRSLRGLKQSERDELLAIQQEIFKAQLAKNKDLEQAEKARYDAAKERILAERDLRRQAMQEAFNLAQTIGQGIADIQKSFNDRDIERITQKKEFELSLTANNKEAQTAIEKKAAAEILEVRRKQARQDKAAALFGIAVSTSQAVMSVLSTGGGTRFADLGVSAAVLTGLVIAQGLAQAAAVAAKPLPEFAKGTQDAPEGPALVGEKGPELRESKGKFYYHDKPTITNLRRGDKIYTATETARMFRDSMITDKIDRQFSNDTRGISNTQVINYQLDTTSIIEGLGKKFSEALANQPYWKEVLNKDEVAKVLVSKNQMTKYYGKKHF